ncbi:MAG: hypothetical protein WCC57_12690 [Paracoccaceae bacterium]
MSLFPIKSAFFALASLVLLPLQANAADPALLEKAAEMAGICAQYMPDVKAAKAAFKAAGLRSEGGEGELHIFSFEDRRVFAAITVVSAAKPRCMIAVSKMTPAEAKKLAQVWVKPANAKPITLEDPTVAAAWLGKFKGGPIVIVAVNNIELNIMRGAAIIALSAK